MSQWVKYPNPYAHHVKSCDTTDRFVDSQGRLRSRRIFIKIGQLPKWGAMLLKTTTLGDALVVEESMVDTEQRLMTTTTRNYSHRSLMAVEEVQEIRPDPQNKLWTEIKTTAKIVSNFGWGVSSRIEQFGARRFARNTEKHYIAVSWVLEKVLHAKLYPASVQTQ